MSGLRYVAATGGSLADTEEGRVSTSNTENVVGKCVGGGWRVSANKNKT